MNKTSNYEMPIYEPNDAPSLIDGYNKALIKCDLVMHQLENRVEVLESRIKILESKVN